MWLGDGRHRVAFVPPLTPWRARRIAARAGGGLRARPGPPAGSRPSASPGQHSSPRCDRRTGVPSGSLPWPDRVRGCRARESAEETSPPSQLCKELIVKNNALDDLADEVFYRGHSVQNSTSQRPRGVPNLPKKNPNPVAHPLPPSSPFPTRTKFKIELIY